jgi:hypothetical protein
VSAAEEGLLCVSVVSSISLIVELSYESQIESFF